MGVGTIVSFIQILQLGILFLVPSILGAVCSIYCFICVYSLYQRFKKDSKTRVGTSNGHYENVTLQVIA